MNVNSYVSEINSLDTEIKRLNAHLKQLRSRKKTVTTNLHKYMIKNKLDKVNINGKIIKLSSIEPKKTFKQKPKKQRKEESLELFRQIGIPDPKTFYEQLESLKLTDEQREHKAPVKKRNDDIFGF